MVFGRDRHRPAGDWVQFTSLLNVAGIHHRREAAAIFAGLVKRAEQKGWTYGVALLPEPYNPQDPFAIRVYGVAQSKKLFGPVTVEQGHIGYLPREEAEAVHRELIGPGLPFQAELYSIFVSDGGFIDIKMAVLGPKGTSASARKRRDSKAAPAGND